LPFPGEGEGGDKKWKAKAFRYIMIDYDKITSAYAKHRQVHPGVFKNLI